MYLDTKRILIFKIFNKINVWTPGRNIINTYVGNYMSVNINVCNVSVKINLPQYSRYTSVYDVLLCKMFMNASVEGKSLLKHDASKMFLLSTYQAMLMNKSMYYLLTKCILLTNGALKLTFLYFNLGFSLFKPHRYCTNYGDDNQCYTIPCKNR